MTKDVLSKALDRLGLYYLPYHLDCSPHNTFEQWWWCVIMQDDHNATIIRLEAITMIFRLSSALVRYPDLQSDLVGCYIHLTVSGGNLEDVPWPIIEEGLDQYWRKKAHD
jgi:hypothetical protein